MPKVSIIIAAYNHEKFVGECIQSALDQTFQDFEIIITDDGSTDRTVEVIKEFTDPRIHLNTYSANKGACTAMNDCIRKAAGEYIAVLNSDDAWEPTKMEKQMKYLNDHPDIGAVFSQVTFVDESGNILGPKNYKYFHIFEQKNRSRYAWLNHFFFKSNCLCHPSVVIRKKCYDDVGLYNERMAGLPDLDMWVKLCLKYEIYILDEKLVRFRIMAGEANASGDRLPTHIRNHFEIMQILNHYLTIKDRQIFLKVFPEANRYGDVESKYIPYFLGILAMTVQNNAWCFWSLQVLYDFLGTKFIERELEEKYGFNFSCFLMLTAKHDAFNLRFIISPPIPSSNLIQIDPLKHGKIVKFAVRVHNILARIMIKIYHTIAIAIYGNKSA